MQVSVETLKGLERKLTVSVPTEKVEEEVGLRLRNLARKVKVPGFRPGKVPAHIVNSRFSDSVREDVAREMVQSTLYEALQAEQLTPAGSPMVEPQELEAGKDFTYTAIFEVLPAFTINEIGETPIELIEAEIKEEDVDNMLTKLREQNKEWQSVSRVAAQGDKVIIDFKGFIGDEAFAGGSAEGYELVLGSGSMIPGFEDQIVGHKLSEPFDIHVSFPKDYNHKDLAGKETRFNITIHDVLEGKLPELDDAFAEKFNVKEGGVDALRKDILDNMSRELERRISGMNRERIFDKLKVLNEFDVPMVLVDKEIEHLKHDMYHRLFGHEHSDNEKIPDFPRNLFEEQANRRVHLGLLFAEYVKVHAIVADKDRVEAMIEKFASAYEDPDELRQWYHSSKERMAEIEALVTEQLVAEKISEKAVISKKIMSYDEAMNSNKNKSDAASDETGE